MINLIKEEMPDHQVIIASISEVGMEPQRVITIQSRLMENAILLEDIGSWGVTG